MSGHLWTFSHMLDDIDLEMAQHDFITLFENYLRLLKNQSENAAVNHE